MLAILFDSYLAGYVVGWNINYLVDYLLSYTVSVPLWDAQHSKRSCCCRWVLHGGEARRSLSVFSRIITLQNYIQITIYFFCNYYHGHVSFRDSFGGKASFDLF